MHKISKKHIIALRVFHGILTVYFTLCLLYLYVVGITGNVDGTLFILAALSLGAEGMAVFAFNRGDCPLIHIQRKIGDDKPFFELLVPRHLAKLAIPVFAVLTVIALVLILLR